MTAISLGSAQALALVVGVSLVLQVASAAVQHRSFESPNLATRIAWNLADRGAFEVAGRRAHQLPGEPWYQAFGFITLPASMHRYLHVPVTVAFITAIAVVALAIAGPWAALGAGLTAALDPFIIAHGPVWDDTFLAAALEWMILATCVAMLTWRTPRNDGLTTIGLLLAAALTTLTRPQSPVALVAIGLALVRLRSFEHARRAGIAVLVGVLVALTVWGARNAVVLGTFYVGTTRDGKTLYESNCAYTRQGIRELGVVGGFLDRCDPVEAARIASMGELPGDVALRRYALHYMTAHPGDVALTAAFKLVVSLTGYSFASPASALRNLVVVPGSLLVLFAGMWGAVRFVGDGGVATPAGRLTVIAGAATASATLIMLLIGPVGLRYRISFTGFLYLGTGILLVRLFERATRDRVTRAFVLDAASR